MWAGKIKNKFRRTFYGHSTDDINRSSLVRILSSAEQSDDLPYRAISSRVIHASLPLGRCSCPCSWRAPTPYVAPLPSAHVLPPAQLKTCSPAELHVAVMAALPALRR